MKYSRLVQRRIESNKKLVDALQEDYSKLNNIRFDLGYSKEHSKGVTLEQANEDLRKFLSHRRNNSIFEHNIGYTFIKEYTKDKGVHIHALLMFDGQKVQKSSFKADELGKHWVESVTDGNGTYHNCHRNNYKNNGIGMLEHNDVEKRENLDKAMEYLCKDTQSIQSLSDNKKDRAMTRSTIPKKKKENIGRPRKK